MDDELSRQLAKIRRDRPLQAALRGPRGPVLKVVTWCFIFASLCHLWLADAWQLDWLPANLIYLAGLALLTWRGAAAGWLLSGVGLAIPLLFHRDQLTQSLILLVFSSTAGLSLLAHGWAITAPENPKKNGARHHAKASWRGSDPKKNGARHHAKPSWRGSGAEWLILSVFRGITICTYLLAVLHKLNRQFFDPAFSCAVYGVDELMAYWNLPFDALPAWLVAAAPWLVLAAEGGIALLYLLRRRHLAWQLAVAFHIPLTLTMAPAFVFVMLVGHAAFLREGDLSRLRAVLIGRWTLLGLAAATLATASLLTHHNLPEWTMIPREWLLWGLLLTLLYAFPPCRQVAAPARPKPSRPKPSHPRPPRPARLAAAAIVGLFALNGLTPYLGVQYQHAGAMVSNLRIDQGCWNSLVFPESVRLTDDYIRVDQVYYGQPGRIPDYEEIVLEQLWSPPQIRQMRRNWCRDDIRPFYMRGTFRGRTFTIDDVCADEPLPFSDDGVFGVEVFEDYLRYQKNLRRECPQSCIH